MTSDADAFSFEGENVTNFIAQLPSVKLEAPEAFPRGTLLTLNVQVRVKSVRLESDRQDNLVRVHVLAVEGCSVSDVLTPAQRQAIIEAAACEAAEPENCATHGRETGSTGQATIEEAVAASTADTIARYGDVLDRLAE